MSDKINKVAMGGGMGVRTLALLNVAAVLSIRNLPSQAEYGWSIIFYLTAASICFFLPSALVSAELASGWPENGGVYLWVKEAFGPRWGFVAIAMQWLENLPWFPAVLTFVAEAIAYVIDPALAKNLELPDNEVIVMLLDLGYASDGSGPLANHGSRKALEETVTYL